jgi:hypothetical protein
MATAQIHHEASKEVSDLIRNLDNVIDEYLNHSEMEKNQRLTNVGRALSALHVGWVANLQAECEVRNSAILGSNNRTPEALPHPVKEF